jgi:hypothetical protein
MVQSQARHREAFESKSGFSDFDCAYSNDGSFLCVTIIDFESLRSESIHSNSIFLRPTEIARVSPSSLHHPLAGILSIGSFADFFNELSSFDNAVFAARYISD